MTRALRDLDALVAHNVFDREPTADGLKIVADGPDSRALEIATLNLGHLPLTDTNACGKLNLRQTRLLSKFAEAICANLSAYAPCAPQPALDLRGAPQRIPSET